MCKNCSHDSGLALVTKSARGSIRHRNLCSCCGIMLPSEMGIQCFNAVVRISLEREGHINGYRGFIVYDNDILYTEEFVRAALKEGLHV